MQEVDRYALARYADVADGGAGGVRALRLPDHLPAAQPVSSRWTCGVLRGCLEGSALHLPAPTRRSDDPRRRPCTSLPTAWPDCSRRSCRSRPTSCGGTCPAHVRRRAPGGVSAAADLRRWRDDGSSRDGSDWIEVRDRSTRRSSRSGRTRPSAPRSGRASRCGRAARPRPCCDRFATSSRCCSSCRGPASIASGAGRGAVDVAVDKARRVRSALAAGAIVPAHIGGDAACCDRCSAAVGPRSRRDGPRMTLRDSSSRRALELGDHGRGDRARPDHARRSCSATSPSTTAGSHPRLSRAWRTCRTPAPRSAC